jgi:hypothetical protein
MTRTVAFALAALAAASLPRLARADRRYYGQTYTAVTAPRGAFDVELWSTGIAPPREGAGPWLWQHQVELETGITDRWDVALYNVWRNAGPERPEYEAVKVETRYRLAEAGRWFVDPVLYLEVKKTFLEDRPLSFEEKVILAKDVGRTNVALNLSAEQERASGKTELEWGWAAGSSYEVAPWLRLGGEAFGSIAEEEVAGGGERTDAKAWIGPAASIAVSRSWLVLAAGFGLGDDSDAFRARAILAFQF